MIGNKKSLLKFISNVDEKSEDDPQLETVAKAPFLLIFRHL